LVYNEIIILPCEILNKNTKVKLAGRSDKPNFIGEGQNPDYMASSPQAPYDANRNKRSLIKALKERDSLVHAHGDGEMYINDVTGTDSERASRK